MKKIYHKFLKTKQKLITIFNKEKEKRKNRQFYEMKNKTENL